MAKISCGLGLDSGSSDKPAGTGEADVVGIFRRLVLYVSKLEAEVRAYGASSIGEIHT